MLHVKNLSRHIKGKTILTKLSFEIPRGRIGIFLGGSGAGKTSLLRAMNNLDACEMEAFILDGQPLDFSDIGMVFQHFNLFENLSVEDNITLALIKRQKKNKTEAKTIARSLLGRYALQDKASARVHELSGGQKQRLAIARTVALNPQIICFDEPTSALDPILTNQIAHDIMELALDNRIVLLTTHDMQLVTKLQGTMFLMDGGAIIETADKEAFHTSPIQYPLLSAFFG